MAFRTCFDRRAVSYALGPVEGPGQPRGASDEVALDDVRRLMVVEPLLDLGFEFRRIFLGQDRVVGVAPQAVLEGVEPALGLAVVGLGSAAFLGVGAVGLELGFGGHRGRLLR